MTDDSDARLPIDVGATLDSLETVIDELLDDPLARYERAQAERLERMGAKLTRAAAALRILLVHPPGSLGAASAAIDAQPPVPAYLMARSGKRR